MVIIKKLIFFFPFLFFFFLFYQNLFPFLIDPNIVFSFSPSFLIQTITLLSFLVLAGLFFTIFVSISQDFKIILPAVFLTSIIFYLLKPTLISLVLVSGYFLGLTIISLLLIHKLKNYLTFKPGSLLAPTVGQFTTVVILVASLVFYLISQTVIKEKGFIIPEELLDLSLSFADQNTLEQQAPSLSPSSTLEQYQITPEQLELLKQNPSLLKQYGLDPSILDTISQTNTPNQPNSSTSMKDVAKEMIRSQVQKIIEPYLAYIPLIYGVLFYFSLTALAALLSIPSPFIIWLLFFIFEKSGFIKFEAEMREAKKLVV